MGGEQVRRFSFIGFSSSKLISCFQDYTEIKDHKGKDIKIQTPDDPLKLIEDEIEGTKYHGLPGHRFSGGAIGYLSYEYASRIEPSIPVPEEDQLKMPLTFFMITEIVIIFDHAHQSLTICANASTKDNPEASFKKAKDKIKETLELLSQPSRIKPTFLLKRKRGNFSNRR